jgi:hypothetical protein
MIACPAYVTGPDSALTVGQARGGAVGSEGTRRGQERVRCALV